MKAFSIKPYRKFLVLLPLNILALILCGFILWQMIGNYSGLTVNFAKNVILFSAFSVFNIALGTYIVLKSFETVVFSDDGVCFQFNKKINLEMMWAEINFVYLGQNIKGAEFVVLSSEKLEKSDVRKLISKSSIKTKMIIDGNCVIPIDDPSYEHLKRILNKCFNEQGKTLSIISL